MRLNHFASVLALVGVLVTAAAATSSSSSSVSSDGSIVKDVVFPFSDTSEFSSKKPVAYNFDVTGGKTTVSITVGTSGNIPSDVTCRLFLFGQDDFSSEYYLGSQSTNMCKIQATVRPGKYQLQIQPTVGGVPYYVNALTGNTDGNDGFMDAIPVEVGGDVNGSFDSSTDLFDWYTFTVTGNKNGTFFFSSPQEDLQCVIYVPSTVDQFGFSGPQCGLQYSYSSGTYTVGIGRKTGADLQKRIDYTVKWR
jgi:hypothetical protein